MYYPQRGWLGSGSQFFSAEEIGISQVANDLVNARKSITDWIEFSLLHLYGGAIFTFAILHDTETI